MKTYVLSIFAFLFFSCQSDREPGAMPSEAEFDQSTAAEAPPSDGDFQMANTNSEEPPQPQPNGQNPTPATPRFIIKNGEVRMQVADVEASTVRAIEQARAIGGYLSEMETVNTNWETSNRLTLRLPAEKFEDFLTSVGKESLFTDYRRVGTQDVTAEYIDLQARLKTRREVKARYEQILREKTRTVEDILNAEEKIRHLQEEIESAEGRLKYLSDQAAMSTLRLDLYQRKEYEEHPVSYSEPFWVKLKEGLVNGWDVLVSIVLFFVNIWPITLLVLGLWFGRKRVFRGIYNRKKQA